MSIDYSDPKNWHRIVTVFPKMADELVQDMADSIAEHGQLDPITLHDGKVLDGRNRILACKLAGVKPTFTMFVENGVPPFMWAYLKNKERRQLTTGQKAACAVEAKPLLETEAKQHQRSAGNPLGKAKSGLLKNEKSTFEKPIHVDKSVAKQFGVSAGYVHAAQKVKDASPALFERVHLGEISIPEAQKQLGHKVSTQAMVSADSNEWYTPENYVKSVKQVLGKVDLDPATCELANKKFLKADNIYTIDDDGLKHKWSGKVFLNPPYGDVGPKFVAKAVHEFDAGRVSEAIILLNSHVTDSKWFKPMFNYVLCFTDHRSRFWNKDGIGGSPTHGSVFCYMGDNPNKFAEVFKHLGSVVEPYTKR